MRDSVVGRPGIDQSKEQKKRKENKSDCVGGRLGGLFFLTTDYGTRSCICSCFFLLSLWFRTTYSIVFYFSTDTYCYDCCLGTCHGRACQRRLSSPHGAPTEVSERKISKGVVFGVMCFVCFCLFFAGGSQPLRTACRERRRERKRCA